MVFPAQLVEKLAFVLDVPVQTVAQHDRLLALSGHRKSGGRGRSAARLSPVDAANLIIAVVGAPVSGPTVKDSAKNFERYAWLPAVEHAGSRRPATWPSDLKILQELPAGHSFRDALACLIGTFARPLLMSSDVFPATAIGPTTSNVEVLIELHGPEAEASITLAAASMQLKPGREGFDYDDFFPDRYERKLWYLQDHFGQLHEQNTFSEVRPLVSGDLRQIRTISELTINTIAKLFR